VKGTAGEWSDPERLTELTEDAFLKLHAEGVEHGTMAIRSLAASLAGSKDKLHLKSFEARFPNTVLAGSGEVRILGDPKPWRLRLASERVPLGSLLVLFDSEFKVRGDIALDLDLTGAGFYGSLLGSNVEGRFAMSGHDIEVDGIDLDAVLSDLERTQKTGLLELGVYALAGPGGALLSRGASYKALLESASREGTGRLAEVHSELRFDAGVLHTQDVAFATEKHRMAVNGSIDLKENGPLNLQIATLGPKGCARYMEEIKGTVAKPEVAKAGVVVKGVITPVTSILGTLASILSQGDCDEPFYGGKVAAPVESPASVEMQTLPDASE